MGDAVGASIMQDVYLAERKHGTASSLAAVETPNLDIVFI